MTVIHFLMLAVLLGFAIIWWIVFQNIEAPDGVKNAIVLITALTPLLGVAYTLQGQPYSFKKNFTFILFYDQKTKRISDGLRPNNPYSNNYWNMFEGLGKDDFEINDLSENTRESKTIDIIENGIVRAITMNFPAAWDREGIVQKFPQGKSITYLPGLIEEKKHISPEEVNSSFRHNPFLKEKNRYDSFGFDLPPGATIISETKDNSRKIVIKNKKTRVEIKIHATGSFVFQKGIQNVFPTDPENMNRYYALYFPIEVRAELKRWPISWREREAYMKWHENIGKALEIFNWAQVEEEIDKDLTRKANELVLKATPTLLSKLHSIPRESGNYPATPEEVVEKFVQLDAQGKRLRQETQSEILSLLSSSDFIGTGAMILINNYKIGKAHISNSTVIVPVEYEELFGLTADSNIFEHPSGKKLIRFQLSRNDVWRIEDILPAPHVHWEAAITHLRKLQALEPDRREQLELTIQKIMK